MATTKKKDPVSQDLIITIGGVTKRVTQKQIDKIVKEMEAKSKGKNAVAAEAVNNSDLCKYWELYGGAARLIVTIIPGIGNLRKVKKGLIILFDAIDSNCTMPLPE